MSLTQLELQHLRHLISSHEMAEKKLNSYANSCNDPQVKQMFQQSAQSASQSREKLISFLA
ncbi:MAG: hypothetical protein GX333_06100 [Syntrophomonadaceae bacterium]|nr:hypothetical protein [Syntrophomonadaceae bacterium]